MLCVYKWARAPPVTHTDMGLFVLSLVLLSASCDGGPSTASPDEEPSTSPVTQAATTEMMLDPQDEEPSTSVEPATPEQTSASTASPTGCAGPPALCCPGQNNSCSRGCFCDQACISFRDCCDDYLQTCPQVPDPTAATAATALTAFTDDTAFTAPTASAESTEDTATTESTEDTATTESTEDTATTESTEDTATTASTSSTTEDITSPLPSSSSASMSSTITESPPSSSTAAPELLPPDTSGSTASSATAPTPGDGLATPPPITGLTPAAETRAAPPPSQPPDGASPGPAAITSSAPNTDSYVIFFHVKVTYLSHNEAIEDDISEALSDFLEPVCQGCSLTIRHIGPA
ncbi:flocculation protein FLO11-like isoform X6 [Salarias fasciatus]|uniref:flocculation protein FLO11-like isoform X6 n=1 Tax=Salarias fasciatus TaxID=181472 RepID=UPI00117676B2|nr:flocculation protein FLO11-like isoform X6 [Salarias fasciatus]